MKAAGIVRRIDDLKQGCDSKECERHCGSRKNALEILNEGQIILKNIRLWKLDSFAVEYAEALVRTTGLTGMYHGS